MMVSPLLTTQHSERLFFVPRSNRKVVLSVLSRQSGVGQGWNMDECEQNNRTRINHGRIEENCTTKSPSTCPSASSWMVPKRDGIQSVSRRGWVRQHRGSPDDAPMMGQALVFLDQCAGSMHRVCNCHIVRHQQHIAHSPAVASRHTPHESHPI